MKNYLVVLAVLVSLFTVSCEKEDVNEGDIVETIDVQDNNIYSTDKTKIIRPGNQG